MSWGPARRWDREWLGIQASASRVKGLGLFGVYRLFLDSGPATEGFSSIVTGYELWAEDLGFGNFLGYQV